MRDADDIRKWAADRAVNGLTPQERADAEAFYEWFQQWPQDAADYDPDEWARAEELAANMRDAGYVDLPAAWWAGVLRGCELYDALQALEADGK